MAYVEATTQRQIYRIPFDPSSGNVSGPPEPLREGPHDAVAPDVSADGERIAFVRREGNAEQVWVVLTLGYAFLASGSDSSFIQPRVTVLVSVDPSNGMLLDATVVRDTNEGLIGVAEDGRLFVSHGSLLSSVFFFGVNPGLPEHLQIPGPPAGGFSVLGPLSFREHAIAGIERTQDLASAALQELPGPL